MAKCQVIIHSWTFCGLVGAFLDLAIAYFLLCCSATAFFAARFLALFGLSLPCPCNGFFGYPSCGPCLRRVLVDYPTETVSNLQLSVKSKFPFDAILARNDQCQLNLKLIKERKSDDGGLEFDAEASYSSFSDPRRSQQSLSGSDSFGKFDVKGKGAVSQRQRSGGIRRRRRGSIDYGMFAFGSSSEQVRPDVHGIYRSPSDPTKFGNVLNVEHSKPVSSHGRAVSDYELDDATDEGKLIYGNASSLGNFEKVVRHVHGVDGEDENSVRILEQALEEEEAARVALYSELEQERIAAATAADEAMAMISRLQEEKAAIEMEARQYQRILEEKSSYDAEEMDILKEIIVRREREKHFLEKELEAYRKLLQENEGLEGQLDDALGQNEASFLGSPVNPMLILEQLGESIDIHRKNNYPDYPTTSAAKRASTVFPGKESIIIQRPDGTKIVNELKSTECLTVFPDHLDNFNEHNQEVQEKGMLSVDEIPYSQLSKTNSSPSPDFPEDATTLVCKRGKNDNVYPHQALLPGVLKIDDGQQMLMQVGEPHVHDVHVIDSKCNSSNVLRKRESSFKASKELEIDRSCSDIADRLQSGGSSGSGRFASDLRRNSLPLVDHERLKIDSELEWLRGRLRAVQEEREKLKSSFKRQERGKVELQLLEDIASQIREIRHLTEPEKAARQASLPPISSKVASRNKRCRRISIGVGQSLSS